ncbi:hypothetical protein MMC10_010579 [Thelotrema lepadinum]|nr:hypothetical protein [Thelotrema lepadinum]
MKQGKTQARGKASTAGGNAGLLIATSLRHHRALFNGREFSFSAYHLDYKIQDIDTQKMGKESIFYSSLPIPLTSISLGRLVVKPKSPVDGYFDPSEKIPSHPKPKTDECALTDIVKFFDKVHGTKLDLALGSFASTFFNIKTGLKKKIATARCTHYQLLDGDSWFEEICSHQFTQFWLERQKMQNRKIYLVTAFRTISDASQIHQKLFDLEIGAGVQAPLIAAVTGGTIPLPSPLDPEAKASVPIRTYEGTQYTIPGERCYAIYYREVKISRPQEEEMSEYTLAAKTKWAEICSVRDAEVDEAVIEAELADSSDRNQINGCVVQEIPEDDESYFVDKDGPQSDHFTTLD